MHIGNAWTDPYVDNRGAVDFWWSHAIISDGSRDSLLQSCNFSGVGPLLLTLGEVAAPSLPLLCTLHVDMPAEDAKAACLMYALFFSLSMSQEQGTLSARPESQAAIVEPHMDGALPDTQVPTAAFLGSYLLLVYFDVESRQSQLDRN